MAKVDVRKIMEAIPKYFKPEEAKGVYATIQCLFTGEQASDWMIIIEDQTCKVKEGKANNPNLTIKADAQDGVNILIGKLDAMRAYMLGKVRVFGDLSLGMKLTKFFEKA